MRALFLGTGPLVTKIHTILVHARAVPMLRRFLDEPLLLRHQQPASGTMSNTMDNTMSGLRRRCDGGCSLANPRLQPHGSRLARASAQPHS